MVVKIKAPAPSAGSAIGYNERKVSEGSATVVYSVGIDDPKKPMETFDIYERGSIRTEKMSFHASINPGKDDKMSEEKVVAFAREWMDKMGYGEQPYIIYKHTDIERTHYHVVSVRVDKEGRKIDDHQEGRRCQKIMKELSEKYEFKIGLGNKKFFRTEGTATKKDKVDYQRFNPEGGQYMKQMEELVAQAMKYHFTTMEQFKMLMRQFRVDVSVKKVRGKVYLTFAGIDPKTYRRCTSPIIAKDLKVPSINEIRRHINESKQEIRNKEKARVANLARVALKYGNSELHTKRILRKKNIGMTLSKTMDGKIFGVTLFDHQTRCVFKASELKGISATEFEKARAEKWPIEEPQEIKEKDTTAEDVALEMADTLISALGAERSRRGEDEEIMRRGQRR